MQVRLNGAWVTPSSAQVYFNGAWRTLVSGQAYVSGAWRKAVSFVQALTLAVSGGYAKATTPTMTASLTATPSGGLGPFTYAWSVVSSTNLSSIAFSSTSVASPNITATVTSGNPGDSGMATVQCTATDSLGSSATTQRTAYFSIFVPPTGTN